MSPLNAYIALRYAKNICYPTQILHIHMYVYVWNLESINTKFSFIVVNNLYHNLYHNCLYIVFVTYIIFVLPNYRPCNYSTLTYLSHTIQKACVYVFLYIYLISYLLRFHVERMFSYSIYFMFSYSITSINLNKCYF